MIPAGWNRLVPEAPRVMKEVPGYPSNPCAPLHANQPVSRQLAAVSHRVSAGVLAHQVCWRISWLACCLIMTDVPDQ